MMLISELLTSQSLANQTQPISHYDQIIIALITALVTNHRRAWRKIHL